MNGPSPRGNRNKIEISEKKKREEELGIKFDGNSFIILRSSETSVPYEFFIRTKDWRERWGRELLSN